LCVCPWQAFKALSYVCVKGQVTTLEWSIFKVIQSGRLLTLNTNIRLGFKGLQGTNTLAYY